MKFMLFARLPPELRRKTWEFALLQASERRVVPIHWSNYKIRPTKYLRSPILAVNQESRGRAKRYYDVAIEVHRIATTERCRYRCHHHKYSDLSKEETDKSYGFLRLNPAQDLFLLDERDCPRYNAFRDNYARLFSTLALAPEFRRRIHRVLLDQTGYTQCGCVSHCVDHRTRCIMQAGRCMKREEFALLAPNVETLFVYWSNHWNYGDEFPKAILSHGAERIFEMFQEKIAEWRATGKSPGEGAKWVIRRK